MRARATACVVALAAALAPVTVVSAEREQALLTADEVVYDRRADTVSAFGNAVVRFHGVEVRSDRLAHDVRADTVLSDTWTVVATSGAPPAILTARWVLFDRRESVLVARGSATLVHRDAVLSAEEFTYDIVRDVVFVQGRPSVSSSGVVITADIMRYDRSSGILDAEGAVVGSWEGFDLHALRVRYDTQAREIIVSSGAEVRAPGAALGVGSARVRVDDAVLEARRFQGYFAPYYGRSARAWLSSGSYTLQDTVVTHCNQEHPHYWFSAREVAVVPDDHIIMRNVVLKVGGVPVFWLPVYWVSLKKRDDCIIIEPGYDGYYGAFARTRYLFPVAGGRMKALCDIYERQGIGGGLEYSYAGSSVSGSMYGYYLQERQVQRARWNVLAQDTRALGREWSLRTVLELISDEGVYQDYFAENWFRIRRDVRSETFVSRVSPGWSLRFGCVRDESFGGSGGKTAGVWRVPGSLTVYPRTVGPFSISDTCVIEPRYVQGVSTSEVTAVNELTCELPLVWGLLSWAPRLALRSTYTNGRGDTTPAHGVRQTYTGALPLRVRFPRGMFELLYAEARHSRVDSFELEQGTAAVAGRSVSPRLDFAIGGFYARAGWSADFRDATVPWTERIAPLSLDAGFSHHATDAGTHLVVHPGSGRIVNAQCTAGISGGWGRLTIGYGYADGSLEPHGITIAGEVRALPALTVRADATASTDGVVTTVSRWSCDFTRDLHCLEARIRMMSRRDTSETDHRDILELWGYIGLKFDTPVPGPDASHAERQTFPWRYE